MIENVSVRAFKKFGDPIQNPKGEGKYMTLWIVPQYLRNAIKNLPARIYLNKQLISPLVTALENLIANGVADELETWDGSSRGRYEDTKTSIRH